MHLDALVVTIGGAARIGDLAELAGGGAHHHHRGIHIAGLADGGIDQRGTDGMDLDRLLAEVERLFWRAERYNHLVLSSAGRFRRSVAYYHEFFAACERRDPFEAERVIHESVRGAVDLISPTLPSELEEAGG